MGIAGIGSNSGVAWGDGDGPKRGGVVERGEGSGDTATISDKARELAQARAEEMASSASTGRADGEECPLEAYRIPDWYAALFGDCATVSGKLGMSLREDRAGGGKPDATAQRLFSEYTDMVNSAYREELDKVGVNGDTGRHYRNFLQDSENQQAVREALYDRLEKNPRAMELMQYFGIDIG